MATSEVPTPRIDLPTPLKPLRLWPGVVAAVLLVLARFIVPLFVPDAGGLAVIGSVAAALVILVWWLLFSRAPWTERIGAIVLMAGALLAIAPLVHPSITNGMMGRMFPVFTTPLLCLALVVAVVASRRLTSTPRRASIAAAIVLTCAGMTLVRTDGVTGDGGSDIHWRWTRTPEERLLAQAESKPMALAPALVAAETGTDWPGFRGPARDGVVPGLRIETDWARKPPVELWRRPIGPGWSSFAVRGDLFYTQEQRGDDEIVSCYHASTGEPVWQHRDAARFWESNAGAGPRATPALSGDRVYTMGATGILNALDAADGTVVWSHNAASDTGAELPGWGFAGSPLVVGDVVIAAASGQLVAYDAATGEQRWLGPTGGAGYSSPHLATIDGVDQILLLRGRRTTSVAPADGTLLWEHSWEPAVSMLQPALIADGDLLIAAGDAMGGIGMRRIAVARAADGWTTEERWTSRGLKPYFSDFVVHKGHAFGFDGTILGCIDLENGERKWKGGRYGSGQLLLLADQDMLLVLSERGELVLVEATPEQLEELARFPAIKGKTWNHPALAGDRLLVRNDQEMAAFRLPLAGG